MFNTKLTIRRIDENEFARSDERWNSLLASSGSDSVFLTWEWLHTWWKHFNAGKKLMLFFLEEDGRLIGIAPFFLSAINYFGLRSLMHIEFLGASEVCSEYLNCIFVKGRELECWGVLLDYLYAQSECQWDVLHLCSMVKESPDAVLLKEVCLGKKLVVSEHAKKTSYFIPLQRSYEDYLGSLSRKTRWKFKNYEKKMSDDYSLEITRALPADDITVRFRKFVALHQKRWAGKNGTGSFHAGRDRFNAFHEEIVTLFSARNWLDLPFLTADGKEIGGQYNYIYNNRVFCYSVGFDPVAAQYQVGTVLQLKLIERYICENRVEFDFLAGEEEYKTYWTKLKKSSVDIAIWRSTGVFRRVKVEKGFRKTLKILLPKRFSTSIYKKFLSRER